MTFTNKLLIGWLKSVSIPFGLAIYLFVLFCLP